MAALANQGSSSWDKLTEVEVQRLQMFAATGRTNEIIIEFVDLFTDIAFAATLYVFSQPGDPGDSFIDVLASTVVTTPATEARDLDFFNSLFIAGLFILLLNAVSRLFVAGLAYRKYRKYINTPQEWGWFFLGALLMQVETHNAHYLLSQKFKDEVGPMSEPAFIAQEIRMNLLLLFAEDIPQLIIQSIFFSEVINVSLSWYLAIGTTALKIVSVIGSTASSAIKLRGLKRAQAKVETA